MRSACVKSLLSRFYSQDRTLDLICCNVDEPIRPLLHIADALVQVTQQRLATQLFHVVVEEHAIELARAGNLALAQAADEEVALPLRQLVARVEREPRYGNRRHPVD